MQKILLSVWGCWIYFLSFCQNDNSVMHYFDGKESRYAYSWGNTKTEVVVTQFGDRKDIVMINLHDNETTSVEAAKSILQQTGGTLIRIDNSNKRLVSFVKNGRTYIFDPNRMFTKTGIKATLLQHSNQSSEAAIKMVYSFGKFVRDKISEKNNTLIALHNNDEGRLSIDSYLPGGPYEKDVLTAYKATQQDPDNFFLTTSNDLYDKLKTENYNSVMQENKKAKDDGSLSIYYGRKNKSYVNVEAEIGKLKEQTTMIQTAVQVIFNNK